MQFFANAGAILVYAVRRWAHDRLLPCQPRHGCPLAPPPPTCASLRGVAPWRLAVHPCRMALPHARLAALHMCGWLFPMHAWQILGTFISALVFGLATYLLVLLGIVRRSHLGGSPFIECLAYGGRTRCAFLGAASIAAGAPCACYPGQQCAALSLQRAPCKHAALQHFPTRAPCAGSAISSIDPVATLAVLADMEVPPLLYNLVFGESVLNE